MMWPLLNLKGMLVLGGVVANLLAGGYLGYQLAIGKHERLVAEIQATNQRQLEALNQQLLAQIARSEELSAAYQKANVRLQQRFKPIYKEVIREVEKPVYRCELPDSGRLLISQAIAAANGTSDTPTGSSPTVSSPDPPLP